MESQIKASFIPQDVGKQPTLRRKGASGGGDLIVLASIILMVASIALAASVFLYFQYLSNSITAKQDSIDRARASIEPALITELSRLDSRMQAAGTLLSQHVAPTILFDLLQQVTLQSIQLTDLELTADNLNSMKITMKGQAQSVNAIALQSDLYGKSGIITSPIFSDINRGANGLMQFRVDGLLNPSAMRYVTLVSAGASAPQTQNGTIQQQQQAPAAGTVQQGTATQSASGTPAFTPVQ